MAVSTCEEYFLIAARRCHTGAPPPVHKFTFQTAEHPHPYCLSRPRVGPSSTLRLSPSPKRGDWRAKWRNHCFCVPAVPLETAGRRSARHPDKLAPSGLICGRLPYGAGRAFRGRPNLDDLRQPSSWRAARIGHQAEPRRRPGACLRGTPAGAASCSITKTPLDDAPR